MVVTPSRQNLVQPTGIEPVYLPFQGSTHPSKSKLHNILERKTLCLKEYPNRSFAFYFFLKVVSVERFELSTPPPQTAYSDQAELHGDNTY